MESAKQMQTLRTVKFNFDTVFGAKGTTAQPAAPRARSSYSSGEVDTIRKESLAQGKADTEASALAQQAKPLGAIAHSLTTVIAQFDAAVLAMRQDSAQLALARLSPLARVGRIRARLLIAHGAGDDSIPFTESLRLADAVGTRAVILETFHHTGPTPFMALLLPRGRDAYRLFGLADRLLAAF